MKKQLKFQATITCKCKGVLQEFKSNEVLVTLERNNTQKINELYTLDALFKKSILNYVNNMYCESQKSCLQSFCEFLNNLFCF